MSEGLAHAYSVRLLYRQTPVVARDDLLAALRRRCGRAEPMGDSVGPSSYLFAFPDHAAAFTNKMAPAETVISIMAGADEADHPDLRQCWGWREARAVVPECRAVMVIADLMASTLPHKARLALIHQTVLAALDVAPCAAIHWRPSEHFVSPEQYLASKGTVKPDAIYPAVNVRLFNIQNGVEDETLMDTVGLAALGLPDLQCHFIGLDTNEVARVLTNSAYYVFEQGDVIEDGHTIQGIDASERWRCRHENAMVEPDRTVLDFDPGPPFSAGKRG